LLPARPLLTRRTRWRNRRPVRRRTSGRSVYNYYRHYDPHTGRYAQSDPIGLAGGLNTYLYANGNPLRFIDPLGLDVEILIGGPAWYGHAAVRVDDRVYSNGRYRTGVAAIDDTRRSHVSGQALVGPNVLTAQRASAYLSQQCPSCAIEGYLLKLTAAQEARVREFYKNLIDQSSPVPGRPNWWLLPDDYAFLGENCADLSAEAARAGFDWYQDIFVSSFYTSPAQLSMELRAAPWLVRERRQY
jgi:RHS repeat-associated protein